MGLQPGGREAGGLPSTFSPSAAPSWRPRAGRLPWRSTGWRVCASPHSGPSASRCTHNAPLRSLGDGNALLEEAEETCACAVLPEKPLPSLCPHLWCPSPDSGRGHQGRWGCREGSVCLSFCLSVCLFVYLFVCLSVFCMSTYLSVYLSECLSIYLSICLSIYLSVCLSLTVLFVCLFLYVYLFV